jgi:hypothetical protein
MPYTTIQILTRLEELQDAGEAYGWRADVEEDVEVVYIVVVSQNKGLPPGQSVMYISMYIYSHI